MSLPSAASYSIRLLAPSGYPHDPDAINRALERLSGARHRIDNIEATQRRYQRFGGTDGERAGDLNRLADPARPLPDIGLAVRGGYGAARILHGLDYRGLERRLRDQPIALVGHSDFTAIQLALYAKARIKTFGGPMLSADFGAETPSEFTMSHFWRTIAQPSTTIVAEAPQVQSVDVSGTLWGGNLAILTSLVGTPYMPDIEGGILFIEDVNEQPFRIERMIYQLHLSGLLARQQALVIGQLTGARSFEYDNGYDMQAMIDQVRAVIGIPVVTGLQFGHVPDLVTLPFGAHAQLVANAHGFRLTLSDYPHLG
ncbi:muramoyltetrapeptide carboxypeptidase [Burkholderia stagnalis]|uniref:Muramoyltetrapeptide carboxypeptidase n=1 Tax=Burkholderia stagnalis TaxID=1503054 RepID=A0A6L3MSL7_9BURK|nr:muramoyltetrapeptide carboxypeptidase [Burkholderia stagnalis]KAB0634496.1 muramoyltetrapeptide carboxypeptidase [Burkholderia stagnalis]KVL84900.1 LD-carboxypeptidase [Burkholderia stagnalis]KVL90515.1 LD-carboxypeptidase [Burkholderia stagnalis]KVM06275.1 LD-carboxypeptidase [Burkholderia stagnalis]KVM87188.1 LD-carboxypeptidase [Burkholderia stagnalis]